MIDHIDRWKGAIGRLIAQVTGIGHRTFGQLGRHLIEVTGQIAHLALDIALLFFQIGIGKDGTIFDRRLNPQVKPVIDALIDQKAKEDRDHDSGCHSGSGEQGHEAQMQPRARILGLGRQTRHPPTHRANEGENQKQINDQEGQNRAAGWTNRPFTRGG